MIETERLLLREYTMDDFDALYEILSDAETMQHYPAPYDEAGTRRWIEWNLDNYSKYGFGLWAVILKENGEFIGDCGLTIQNIDGKQLPEIGYHIHKKYWRRGFAKEAGKAVRDWAFENTDYPSLYSYCKYTNEASYKTAEAIGFRSMVLEKEKDPIWNPSSGRFPAGRLKKPMDYGVRHSCIIAAGKQALIFRFVLWNAKPVIWPAVSHGKNSR